MFIPFWILLIIAVIFIYAAAKIVGLNNLVRRLRREIDKLEGDIEEDKALSNKNEKDISDSRLGDAEGKG